MEAVKPDNRIVNKNNPKAFLLDLAFYIPFMFLVREIYFPTIGFLANGLFWSFSTLAVALWRMRVRGVSWKALGLRKPENLLKTLLVTGLILISVVVSIILFGIIKDQFSALLAADTSSDSAVSKFGDLKGNWPLFFSIITMVWIESALEELLDRGFLMNWLERLFSGTGFATILAVIIQAAIFGFRHSNDLSERSISVAIVGLIMGIAYMAFGRNLWPLIIAHCVLNSMSMVERVL